MARSTAVSEEAFGIDQTANIRLGLEYSPDGRFMFGIGRSSFQKMVDGFLSSAFSVRRPTTACPYRLRFCRRLSCRHQEPPSSTALN
ncbi:DUF5777 family beta-barrel protein [Candidatus Pollutiaquabacter sp.]|uniref:DUF5777 family beta-barrel protein n=1 Tax=Candidatus Pollutiaquabacter sp. TaxID=3416354 RepID=UPI003D0F83C5